MSIGSKLKVTYTELGAKCKTPREGTLVGRYKHYILVQFNNYREAFLIGDIMCKRVKCEVII